MTPSRKISSTVLSARPSRQGSRTAASAQGMTTAAIQATSRRGRGPVWARAERVRAALGWVTTCTSMSPESATMALAVLGRNSCARRPCRGAPTMIWVALTDRANSSTVPATSSPTMSCRLPPRFSASRRCRSISVAEVPTVASDRTTCTAISVRPATRPAIRAPRRSRVLPSGPPVSATTIRSRAAQVPLMPCCARYRSRPSSTRSATQSSASSRRAVRLPSRK